MSDGRGWIRLYRSLEEHWLWPTKKGRKFTKCEAWLDLLISANFRDGKAESGGKFIPVKRGQVLTSQVALARKWLWHRTSVISFFSLLKSDRMIDIQTSTGYTLITIRNYETYQGPENEQPDIPTDIAPDIEATSKRHRSDTSEEFKNEKKGRNIEGSSRKRGSSIREDYSVTDAIREFATARSLPSPDEELEHFKSWHQAKGTLMKDWDAAFRTWLLKAKTFRGNGSAETREERGRAWEELLQREREKLKKGDHR